MLRMSGARALGTCLVTGGSGFIGAALLHRLRREGVDARGPTRDDLDLMDRTAVAATISKIAPDAIFHLAATPPHRCGGGWKDAAAELAMLTNLLSTMPQDARLLATGTMAEIGFSGRHDERAICRPNTPYGFAKHACSNAAVAYRVTRGREICVARLFGVYGPGEGAGRLIPHLLARLRQGGAVPLSDGRQVRDFVHVEDVCEVLLHLATSATTPPLVNVGTGAGISVRQLCEAVADWTGADRDLLRFGSVERRPEDEDELVADTSLLARTVSFVPPQRFSGSLDFLAEFSEAFGT